MSEPAVPGEFRCPDCGFVVIKSIINPETGATGRDSRDRMETCPNDGAILRPITYREALSEARNEACKTMPLAKIGALMEVLLHNLVVRGRLDGVAHEKKAAQNLLQDWAEVKASEVQASRQGPRRAHSPS